jgi:hypothetical protein
MDCVSTDEILTSGEMSAEDALWKFHNSCIAPSQIPARGKKPGRPKMVAQQPLDISSASEIWDRAGKYTNVKGYFFRQLFDHYYGKCRSRLEHVLVWERINGKEKPCNCCIHHRDLNRRNNSAENLMCIPIVLHQELHAQLRNLKKTLSSLAFEVERQRITNEYEEKSAEIMEMWEILQGCK